MECVSMRKRGTHFLTLQVPGLAERRPSLVHGDHIYVQLVADDANDTSFSYQVCAQLMQGFSVPVRVGGISILYPTFLEEKTCYTCYMCSGCCLLIM